MLNEQTEERGRYPYKYRYHTNTQFVILDYGTFKRFQQLQIEKEEKEKKELEEKEAQEKKEKEARKRKDRDDYLLKQKEIFDQAVAALINTQQNNKPKEQEPPAKKTPKKEEKIEQKKQSIDKNDIATMIKDTLRSTLEQHEKSIKIYIDKQVKTIHDNKKQGNRLNTNQQQEPNQENDAESDAESIEMSFYKDEQSENTNEELQDNKKAIKKQLTYWRKIITEKLNGLTKREKWEPTIQEFLDDGEIDKVDFKSLTKHQAIETVAKLAAKRDVQQEN